jgi:hypothetical protein
MKARLHYTWLEEESVLPADFRVNPSMLNYKTNYKEKATKKQEIVMIWLYIAFGTL